MMWAFSFLRGPLGLSGTGQWETHCGSDELVDQADGIPHYRRGPGTGELHSARPLASLRCVNANSDADVTFSKVTIASSRFLRRSSAPAVRITVSVARVWAPERKPWHRLIGSSCLPGEECPSWMVPISICTSEDPKCSKLKVLLDRPEITVTVSGVGPDQWVKVSSGCRPTTDLHAACYPLVLMLGQPPVSLEPPGYSG